MSDPRMRVGHVLLFPNKIGSERTIEDLGTLKIYHEEIQGFVRKTMKVANLPARGVFFY